MQSIKWLETSYRMNVYKLLATVCEISGLIKILISQESTLCPRDIFIKAIQAGNGYWMLLRVSRV